MDIMTRDEWKTFGLVLFAAFAILLTLLVLRG